MGKRIVTFIVDSSHEMKEFTRWARSIGAQIDTTIAEDGNIKDLAYWEKAMAGVAANMHFNATSEERQVERDAASDRKGMKFTPGIIGE